ncbi:MAG: integrin alpha, partial [Planctomycetota bacterium]|nr:integrin alpha [Planctomycetota bacterium]
SFTLQGQIEGSFLDAHIGGGLGSLPDINGDGDPDFFAQLQGPVMGSARMNQSLAYESAALNLKFSVTRAGMSYSNGMEPTLTTAIGDCNGDGTMDFVVATDFHTVSCVDGLDGSTVFWSWQEPSSGASIDSLISTSDLDGDGLSEILVNSGGNRFLISGSSGSLVWVHDATGETPAMNLLGDLNGDNIQEIAVLLDFSSLGYFKFQVLDGSNGGPLLNSPAGYSSVNTSPPTNAGDINGDGIEDAVWAPTDATGSPTLTFLDGATLLTTQLASYSSPSSSARVEGGLDFDGDTTPDSIVYGVDPVLLISGADGSTIASIDNPTDDVTAWATRVALLNLSTGPSVVINAPNASANGFANAGVIFLYTFSAGSGGPIGGGDQESPGGDWSTTGSMEGANAGDQLGYSIAGLGGDLNSDGCSDVLISAVGADTRGFTDNGQVHVVSGANLNTTIYSLNGLQDNSFFGISVDALGDIDGDTFPDFIVGAAGELDAQGTPTGAAYIYSGQTGALLMTQQPSVPGLFGYTVAGIGDINGDGTPDYAVRDALAFSVGGEVTIYDGATHLSIVTLSTGNSLDHYGSAIEGLGDVNADGFDDFAIGAYGADLIDPVTGALLLTDCGLVEVYAGSPLSPSLLWREYGENDDDQSGYSLARSTDMDGDGDPDFVVGEPGFDVVTTARGVTLNGAGRARRRTGKNGGSLGHVSGGSEGGRNGYTTGAGDHNGDGDPDVSAGSPGSTSSIGTGGRAPLTQAGMITIWNGRDDSIMYRRMGTNQNERLGETLANVGDINCDGRDDLILGSPKAPNSNGDSQAGAVVSATFDPYANASGTELSVGAGGTITFDVDLPSQYAGLLCHTLNSLTGVGPIDIAGLAVPLTIDNAFWDSVFGNYPKGDWINPLDALGDTSFVLQALPGGAAPWLGQTAYFSFVAHRFGGMPQVATGVLSVTFVP